MAVEFRCRPRGSRPVEANGNQQRHHPGQHWVPATRPRHCVRSVILCVPCTDQERRPCSGRTAQFSKSHSHAAGGLVSTTKRERAFSSPSRNGFWNGGLNWKLNPSRGKASRAFTKPRNRPTKSEFIHLVVSGPSPPPSPHLPASLRPGSTSLPGHPAPSHVQEHRPFQSRTQPRFSKDVHSASGRTDRMVEVEQKQQRNFRRLPCRVWVSTRGPAIR